MFEKYPTWIADNQKNVLLAEREQLLNKKFAGPFNRVDHVRLEWVRWQLDRLDSSGHTTLEDKK